jgi:hypothetical protein
VGQCFTNQCWPVGYRHRFDVDPDPNFHADADPDLDPDWHQNDVDPRVYTTQ